jgi:Protein of unknown function (DUF1573)
MKWVWPAILRDCPGRSFRAIVLAAVFSLAWCGRVSGAPQIAIDHQFWDFGTITNGGIFSHDYCVSNAGDAPLIISDVVSTCGMCLHAFIDTTNVPPGTATVIHAKLDLRLLNGAVSRGILVNCNDPQNPASVLELNGVSVRLYQVDPLAPVLDLTSGPNATTAEITPSFNLRAPLSRVSCDDTNLEADISPEAGGAFLLTVRAADWFPGDSGVVALTIRSSNTNDPPCSLGVYVRNPPKMELLPTRLTFQPQAEQQTRVLWVKQHGSSLLELLDAIPPPGHFHCEIDPDPDGYDYAIYVTASQLSSATGQIGTLLLKMTDASHQEKDVEVPVRVGTP